MNDEELRAFLDSATVEDEDGATDHNSEATESEAADQTDAPAAETAPRRAVPSFDELMNMSTPDAAAAPAQRAPEIASAQPKAAAPVASESFPAPAAPAPAVEELRAVAPKQGNEWSQAYAQDDEQLVPLILPGFSSEPRPRRDLPPVFQAEPAAPQQPETQHIDPAPTQPFDVLNDVKAVPESEKPQTKTPIASNQAAAALGVAAATATASTGTAPTASPAMAPIANTSQAAEDPFAMLAPDLAASETDSDEYERISVTGGVPRGRKALPWLIVGGGVVIAIIASIFVINGVRSTEDPAPSAPPAATSEPAPTETTTPKPEPSEEPAPEPNTAPVVDPGSTWTLPIDQWGITVEVSEKLGGSTPYTLFDGNTRVMFDSLPVAAGLSDACAAARAENVWGLLKKDDGKLEVVRPEPRCTSPSDAAVYDTIWGVLDYMAKSAKPA